MPATLVLGGGGVAAARATVVDLPLPGLGRLAATWPWPHFGGGR
jgi:hypothetical protein